MNLRVMEALGFHKEVELIKEGKCPFYMTPITKEQLEEMSPTDRREYEISGVCKRCQNKTFGGGR